MTAFQRLAVKRVVYTSIAYAVGIALYRAVVHHIGPHWSDLGDYASRCLGASLASVAILWFSRPRPDRTTTTQPS
ncbi:hypothetical protein AciX8_0495 [Granulicella mallensis MP5ACTX8]|uniref:Uncharacterized protein n=1 Tax=Granulicella mallensis (strain ATCC BAA-1857 / DSM 23137 / MP5ACTX8) TaxID=682795 RepID=G8NPC6_GRAMM|nr:hypothetical protein AciX8_0495 [Granulicella mallensis MP5ACTX8]